jgi:hypothetical protein
MVMFVPSHRARVGCIRCGGIEFHALNQSECGSRQDSVMFETTSHDPPFPALALAGAEFTAQIGSVAVT